jgi:hypothetical protein
MMRRICILTTLLFSLSISAFGQGTPGILKCAFNGSLDVHATRESSSPVITKIKCGDPILLIDNRVGSAHVRSEDGKDGFITGMNFGQWSIEPESAPPASAEATAVPITTPQPTAKTNPVPSAPVQPKPLEKETARSSSQKVYSDCGSLGELPFKSRLSEGVRNCNIFSANNQWYVDFAAANMDYLETESGVPFDTEKGWAKNGGVQTSFTVQRDWLRLSNLYVNVTFTWTNGTITHGEANPVFNGYSTNSDIKNLDSRIGKGFRIDDRAQITPYFGIGTHFWDRDTSGHPGGYLENYGHSYAGGGLMVQYSPFGQWVLSAYGLGGVTFRSHMSTPDFPRPPHSLDFTLGNDTMYTAGGSADHAITRRWHANVGIDWNHFNYGQSAFLPTLGGPPVHEPDSRTSNVTVKAGVGYSF